jgi:hypothetical protein
MIKCMSRADYLHDVFFTKFSRFIRARQRAAAAFADGVLDTLFDGLSALALSPQPDTKVLRPVYCPVHSHFPSKPAKSRDF